MADTYPKMILLVIDLVFETESILSAELRNGISTLGKKSMRKSRKELPRSTI